MKSKSFINHLIANSLWHFLLLYLSFYPTWVAWVEAVVTAFFSCTFSSGFHWEICFIYHLLFHVLQLPLSSVSGKITIASPTRLWWFFHVLLQKLSEYFERVRWVEQLRVCLFWNDFVTLPSSEMFLRAVLVLFVGLVVGSFFLWYIFSKALKSHVSLS